MRAARYERFGGPIDVVTLPDPSPTDDGIVVRVEVTGICRSDWHAWRGDDDDVAVPQVPGHEFAGTVVAVGTLVSRLTPGMRVVVPFVLACGECTWCREGEAQVCPRQLQPGFHLPGSFAEYVAVPRADFNAVPLPDDVAADAAAALGCRYTTAWRGVVQQGRLGGGQRLVVFGCGGVGLAAIQIALARHAEVVAVDPSPEARARATSFGAHAVPDADALDTRSFDVALDAIGHAEVAATALRLLRPRGRYVQVGILAGDGVAAVPLNAVMRYELEIIGSHGMAASGFPELIRLVQAGDLDPGALVTDRVDLAAGVVHLQHMQEHAGRIVTIDRFAP